MDDVRIYNRALSEEEIQMLVQEGANQPPIADAGDDDQPIECTAPTGTPVSLDGTASSDPDNDPLTFTWTGPFPEGGGTVTGPTPTVTLPLGTHTITLTVEDGNGGTDSDDVEITVEDMTPPEITVAAAPIVLWPPNHKYHTIHLSDFVTDASDACDPNITPGSLAITSVSSDEPENGGGDGNTTHDIIIAGDCQSVDLRAERQGSGNGRVYTLTGATTDANGNTAEASFQVQVPHNKKGTATDNGAAYAVTCGTSKRAALSTVETPTGFELSAAYPNPFNPTTVISFALPEAAHVRLLVFDILGREVARLIDGPRPAGHHQAVFKADRLPSGTYLYRIEAGSFAETRMMLLLK